MTGSRPHIVIVGGGIAGLSAAWRLQSLRAESGVDYRISLYEADQQVGGKLQTEHSDGMVIEAGPDSFLSYKPAGIRLARELGIEDRIIGTRDTGDGTFILRDGRLEPLPEGITMMVPTKLRPLIRSRLLSTQAKLRMAAEYFIPPRTDDADESIGSFISRRLGREAFDRMAQPLLSGIFAGDADQLSLASTFPRLRDIERKHGGLVKGMLHQRRNPPNTGGSSSPYPPFVSFAGGMGELAQAIVGKLSDVEIHTNAPVESVSSTESGYRLQLTDTEPVHADALLLATPAWATASLVDQMDGELSAILRRIPFVSSATIALGYRAQDIAGMQSGRGFVIPHVEDRELTAVTWASNKFDGRAPDDMALLRTFVGRAGREEAVSLPDDDLLKLVRHDLQEILGITATPVLSRINRWYRAMPQYVLGHQERLSRIDSCLERHPGLDLLGASYRGVGIPDCIDSGDRAAQNAHQAILGALVPQPAH
jgi:protoporphyrinogen/coproporphyrinogen III oxidase